MKNIKSFNIFLNEEKSEKKYWYNDRLKWEKDRSKLNCVDDNNNISYGQNRKIIAFWYDKREEGWIIK